MLKRGFGALLCSEGLWAGFFLAAGLPLLCRHLAKIARCGVSSTLEPFVVRQIPVLLFQAKITMSTKL